jgi:hypothetical protein
MIAPIDKNYFYSIIGLDKVGWRKLFKFYLAGVDDESRFIHKEKLYFEKLETKEVFVYLPEYRMVLIPECFPDLSISEDEEIVFSDWDMKIFDSHDERYTINVFHRSTQYSFNSLTPQLEQILRDCPKRGRILLTNSKTGYSRDVNIFKDISEWDKRLYLGYPEKLELPLNMARVFEIDKEITNIILWTQKKQ